MKKLKIFENENFGKMRAMEKDGEPWFVGKDVALGYGDGKSLNNAVANHVDSESSRGNLIPLSHHRTCRSAYGGST